MEPVQSEPGSESTSYRPGERPRKRKAILAFASTVGLLTGAITGFVAAVYALAPDLRPRERLGGSITSVSVQQDVSYGDYLHFMYGSAHVEESDDRDPSRLGSLVLVSGSVIGYENRSYAVGITVLDATDRTWAPLPEEVNSTGSCENRSIRASEDSAAWRCWVDNALLPDEYLVTAYLYDGGPTDELTEGGELYLGNMLHFLESGALSRTKVSN